MTFFRPGTAAAALAVLFTFGNVPAQSPPESSFSLLLAGACGAGTEYRYLLKRAGDSGVVVVNGTACALGWTEFRRLKHAVVNYAMDLTEAGYGAPKDSADFTGELTIAALDRNHILRLSAALTLGTLENGSMTGLLRLLMRQVDDSLRLRNVSLPLPARNKRASARQQSKNAVPPVKTPP